MNIELARNNMISNQIYISGVTDIRLINILLSSDRGSFVPNCYRGVEFVDDYINLDDGHYMFSPSVEANILHHVKTIRPNNTLVVGSEGGHLISLLSKLSKNIVVLDDDEAISQMQNKIDASNILYKTCFVDSLEDCKDFDCIILLGYISNVPEEIKRISSDNCTVFYFSGDSVMSTFTSARGGSHEPLFDTAIPYPAYRIRYNKTKLEF